MRALLLAPLTLVLALGAIGCESYSESVSCSMGTVLDENDRCVAPPTPDGGTAIETCDALCAELGSWSAERVGCLEEQLGAFGPPPAECMTDLTEPASCGACITAAGVTDLQCATTPSLCP